MYLMYYITPEGSREYTLKVSESAVPFRCMQGRLGWWLANLPVRNTWGSVRRVGPGRCCTLHTHATARHRPCRR